MFVGLVYSGWILSVCGLSFLGFALRVFFVGDLFCVFVVGHCKLQGLDARLGLVYFGIAGLVLVELVLHLFSGFVFGYGFSLVLVLICLAY